MKTQVHLDQSNSILSSSLKEAPKNFRLYSLLQVITMSALLTGIAGAVLMAINAKRLGERQIGAKLILGMVLLYCALLCAVFTLPEVMKISSTLSQVPTVIAAVLYRHFQQAKFREHKESGGRKAGNVPLILSILLVLGLGTALYVSFTPYYARKSLAHPVLDEDGSMVVLDRASEEEGRHVIRKLKDYAGFFVLKKRNGSFILETLVSESYLREVDPHEIDALAGDLYDRLEELRPLEIGFVDYNDNNHQVLIKAELYSLKRKIPYGKLDGYIYYLGDMSEQDAVDFRREADILIEEGSIDIVLEREGQELSLVLFSGSQWSEDSVKSLQESFQEIVENLGWKEENTVHLKLASEVESTIELRL